jgi:hypothetical protein
MLTSHAKEKGVLFPGCITACTSQSSAGGMAFDRGECDCATIILRYYAGALLLGVWPTSVWLEDVVTLQQ